MEGKIKNVLAATDFSETGNNAVMIAIKICKQHDAVLHLLHVVENKYIVAVAESSLDASVMHEIDQEARSQLYNLYERILADHQVRVQIHMPIGTPYIEICKTASEMPIDLIVMGSRGASGLKEFFIGTTAFRVIKNTNKAVLTIPANFGKANFNRILFPIRFVEGIKEKYRITQFFIKRDTIINIAVLYDEEKEEQMLDCRGALADMLLSLKNCRVTCSIEMYPCSNIASKVLELTHTYSADLVVINATNDHNWVDFLRGSYTQRIVNHSAIAVLSFCHEGEKQRTFADQQHQPESLNGNY